MDDISVLELLFIDWPDFAGLSGECLSRMKNFFSFEKDYLNL